MKSIDRSPNMKLVSILAVGLLIALGAAAMGAGASWGVTLLGGTSVLTVVLLSVGLLV